MRETNCRASLYNCWALASFKFGKFTCTSVEVDCVFSRLKFHLRVREPSPHCMNKDEEDSSASNDLSPNQQQTPSSIPNLRKHKMSDTPWDVNGDGKLAFTLAISWLQRLSINKIYRGIRWPYDWRHCVWRSRGWLVKARFSDNTGRRPWRGRTYGDSNWEDCTQGFLQWYVCATCGRSS